MFLPSLLKVLRQVLFLDFFDDIPHFDRIVDNCIFPGFFLPHDLEHRVFVEQLEVLTSFVGDLFLENVFAFLLFARFGSSLSGEILLVGFLLLDFVSPVVHPLHSVEM